MHEEEVVVTVPKDVFYNQHMRFCRSIASLAVGTIEEGLEVCDAFCASGIRGIRYAKENMNVKKIIFLDIDKRAVAAAKKNIQKNKLKAKTTFVCGNISRLVFDLKCDFAEIDQFGSPVPYLYDSFRFFNPLKRGYLSVTATDVAVTCGGKERACMKNYHSKPLNNEFTHETGIRILLKKIAETAAEFNMGIEPLLSLSHRHYQKVIVKCTRSAEAADRAIRSLGYINYCSSCGWRSSSQFPVFRCQCLENNRIQNLKHTTHDTRPETQFAGPLWLGELHNGEFLGCMRKLNGRREYADKRAIEKTLALMQNEVGMPPHYYNVHELCRRCSIREVPRFEELIGRLRQAGHSACRTHFCEKSVKSGATLAEIRKCIARPA